MQWKHCNAYHIVLPEKRKLLINNTYGLNKLVLDISRNIVFLLTNYASTCQSK